MAPPVSRILQRPQDSNPRISHATKSAEAPPRPLVPYIQGQPLRSLYPNAGNPGFQQRQVSDPLSQVDYLNHLASQEVPKAEITREELEEKETFRQHLEDVCHKAFTDKYTGDIASIKLVMFGSLASEFATPASDMDLAIVPEWKDPTKAQGTVIERDVPRLLERAILDAKMGGRLLTRTRVPILKVCEKPTEELYNALVEERCKWDELPEEEQYSQPAAPDATPSNTTELDGKLESLGINDPQDFPTLQDAKTAPSTSRLTPTPTVKHENHSADGNAEATKAPATDGAKETGHTAEASKECRPRAPRQWQRERKKGPLDFPKSGVGIQCDINFSNDLALHNTQLLRCYSLTDPRVRPIVLFVKAWAKRRKINSAYSGTLSSYGWVLMVLHYLVNIASPPVCPNLQSSWRPTATRAEDLEKLLQQTTVSGYAVRFWRDEAQIAHHAATGQLTRNTQTIGDLLRGFFHYYASIPHYNAFGQRQMGFYWSYEVLSLRTPGGILRKDEKGWTKATTTYSNGQEVRQRYLFAIEDPFELDHNVARTVTHDGIVAIRDELRRVGRILNAVGRAVQPEGGLFDEIVEPPPEPDKTEPDTETLATLAVSAGLDAGAGSSHIATVTGAAAAVVVAATSAPGTEAGQQIQGPPL
ncbi:PAP/OAS1 substrate-binding domain-containing protein [Bimuria novae-zelandiae CBS 107.79]|uniref:polynucleotide adenylyltransferase n=1 Tax=Bimuria novae-zelandiae CBS 107.79 TaxID=1447943 RepID=A0A6A5VCF3_9PLEO|nr:PAP/OAS1 substrate-binding domain-containing protein [Bimuria novae-zelandiae CBS 107.79]